MANFIVLYFDVSLLAQQCHEEVVNRYTSDNNPIRDLLEITPPGVLSEKQSYCLSNFSL